MGKTILEVKFAECFPALIKTAIITYKSYEYNGDIVEYCTIEHTFADSRFSVWMSDDSDGIIVGINELHYHFDCFDSQQNIEDGINHFTEIIEGRYVVVVEKESTDKNIICTTDIDTAFKKYGSSEYEIIAFRGSENKEKLAQT